MQPLKSIRHHRQNDAITPLTSQSSTVMQWDARGDTLLWTDFIANDTTPSMIIVARTYRRVGCVSAECQMRRSDQYRRL
jgi:hypothetical protein